MTSPWTSFLIVALLNAGVAPAQMAASPDAVPSDAELVAVKGDTELSPAEAFQSARLRADELLRERWEGRADRIAKVMRPRWLPQTLYLQATRRWLGTQPLERSLKVVDRQDREREHDFGTSWQTTLWVAEDPRAVADAERQLRGELRRVEKRTIARGGLTVGFWAALGLTVAWLDRLSRGYMTGRLRFLGLLLAVAVPTVLFLL